MAGGWSGRLRSSREWGGGRQIASPPMSIEQPRGETTYGDQRTLNPDPLGIGLRQRANEARQAYEAQNRELARQNGQLVSFSNLGPISDPAWDAWKQALAEQGVDKLSGGSLLPESRFGATDIYGGTTAQEGQTPITELERRGGYDRPQTAAREAFRAMRRR